MDEYYIMIYKMWYDVKNSLTASRVISTLEKCDFWIYEFDDLKIGYNDLNKEKKK